MDRFRRPFDWSQRAQAAKLHRQYRENLKTIRSTFPPGTARERALLRAYNKAVQDFARELLHPNDKVNVQRLNELERHASNAAIEYNIERTLRRLHDDDAT